MQTSFKGAKSVTDFENRVNQIYEGDGLVLIRAEQTDTALVLEGWEDLNGNYSIDDGQDEKLFSITEKDDKSYDMRGYHANSYYHSTWGPGSFLFTYLLVSSPRRSEVSSRYRFRLCQGQAKLGSQVLPEFIFVRAAGEPEQHVFQQAEGLCRIDLRLRRSECQRREAVLPIAGSFDRVIQEEFDRSPQ